jgi:hypothetical protein
MTVEQYNEQRATVLNALYCSVRSAIESRLGAEDIRLNWIADDLKVAKKKIEAIEEEMRVALGDPFANEEK